MKKLSRNARHEMPKRGSKECQHLKFSRWREGPSRWETHHRHLSDEVLTDIIFPKTIERFFLSSMACLLQKNFCSHVRTLSRSNPTRFRMLTLDTKMSLYGKDRILQYRWSWRMITYHIHTTRPHDQRTRQSHKVGREEEDLSSNHPELVALWECLKTHPDNENLLYLTDSETTLQWSQTHPGQ